MTEQHIMGDQSDTPRPDSYPDQLRRLLAAADGSEHERAWSEFLDCYSRLILYVARRTARDHDVVMDRYAFVIERLREQRCRRLRTFASDGRGKFTTWLMVVVRRLCLDWDRHKYGRVSPQTARSPVTPRRLLEVVLDPEVLDRIPEDRTPTDVQLDWEQTIRGLEAAIATLSSSDQLLLSLRYHDNRSAREIASLLSLPTAFHVYRWLNRLHDTLRQALTSPPRRERAAGGATPDAAAVQYRWRDDEPVEPTP
jgi:RNA polymerase sigma factor (sigma-70 family)